MIGTFLPLVLLSFTAMVSSCVAYGCTNRSKSGSGRSFFRFSLKKPKLLAKWVQAIHRKNWSPNNYSRICSDHFDPSSLVKGLGKLAWYWQKMLFHRSLKHFPNICKQSQKRRGRYPKRGNGQILFLFPLHLLQKLHLIMPMHQKLMWHQKIKYQQIKWPS